MELLTAMLEDRMKPQNKWLL